MVQSGFEIMNHVKLLAKNGSPQDEEIENSKASQDLPFKRLFECLS